MRVNKFLFRGVSIEYTEKKGLNNPESAIIYLHGFAGSAQDWDDIIEMVNINFTQYALSLPGFGNSDKPSDIRFYQEEYLCDLLYEFIHHIPEKKIVLAGYSMGGRLALTAVILRNLNVHALILESCSAGIEDVEERNKRLESDKKLSEFILESGVEKFVDYWSALPIFNSQQKLPAEILAIEKAKKLRNNPASLSLSLRGFGAGTMSSQYNNLGTLLIPVRLIAGEQDSKYVAINRKMVHLFKNASFFTVANAGHNVHLEKPVEFVNLLIDFLKNL